MSTCVDNITLCITRGTTWELDVGLSDAWVEVLDNPTDYSGKLVFRAEQSDSSPVLLTLVSPIEIVANPVPGDQQIFMTFYAEVSETQALPYYNIVAYCDIIQTALPEEVVGRLFNATVDMGD